MLLKTLIYGEERLEKTLKLLSPYPPGTYLPDDVQSYDMDELTALGAVLARLRYGPSSLRKFLQERFDVTITRADFYSEIPRISEIENSFKAPSLLKLDEIFPPNEVMLSELMRLMPASEEFNPPKTTSSPHDYAWEGGGQFSYSDAMAYYAMIRTRKPSNILEIGSGWSTRIAREACKKNGHGRIVCVEPYPSDALRMLPDIELIEKQAQELDSAFFNEILGDGDILFIDSTHTVKHDSDCLHIYLRILPNINKKITVHVHDIFLPNTLPIERMRDSQIFWNEQYLVYLYLLLSAKTNVLYSSAYHFKHNREMLDKFMHGRFGSGGGSIWFEQMGSPLRETATA
jgi:hypothetical protein